MDGLPEELKLLFSALFHQIKNKRQAYTQQQFTKECCEILKVKREIYTANGKHTKSKMVNYMLRENVTLLKKKTMDLVHLVNTESNC